MSATLPAAAPQLPEHNLTGLDFNERSHLRYTGPLLDVHSHVMQTRPTDPPNGMPSTGPGATIDQAEIMLAVAEEFGIRCTWTMCPADDIEPLRQRFGERIRFNGPFRRNSTNPTPSLTSCWTATSNWA